jgi:hypothetical protein
LYYSPDSYVYLIPVLIAFSIWMALGSSWVVQKATQKYSFFGSFAKLGILAFFIARAIFAIPAMNLSTDRTAEQYAQTILSSAPPNAIIFSDGDEETFSLWYFHYASRQRPDITVVSKDLLIQPWYPEVLRYTYPGLIIPDHPLEQDFLQNNPHRPICNLAPDLQASIQCSTPESFRLSTSFLHTRGP